MTSSIMQFDNNCYFFFVRTIQYKHFDTSYVKIGLLNAKLLANLFRLSETYQQFGKMGVVKKLHGGTLGPKIFPVNMLFLSPQTQG